MFLTRSDTFLNNYNPGTENIEMKSCGLQLHRTGQRDKSLIKEVLVKFITLNITHGIFSTFCEYSSVRTT